MKELVDKHNKLETAKSEYESIVWDMFDKDHVMSDMQELIDGDGEVVDVSIIPFGEEEIIVKIEVSSSFCGEWASENKFTKEEYTKWLKILS